VQDQSRGVFEGKIETYKSEIVTLYIHYVCEHVLDTYHAFSGELGG